MTKKILSLAVAFFMFVGAKAQIVQETTVKIGDFSVAAYTVTINQNDDLTEEAMKARLKEAKLKTKKTDGFLACLGQTFTDISSSPINFYTKVEGQGKKDNRTSVITVAAVSSDINASNNSSINDNVMLFLENFVTYVSKYEAKGNLEIAQKNLKKAQKTYQSAQSDKEKLEKNIKSSQEKIVDKRKEIEKYNEKIKDCQEDIRNIESDIKKNNDKRAEYDKKMSEADQIMKQAEAEVNKYQQLAN